MIVIIENEKKYKDKDRFCEIYKHEKVKYSNVRSVKIDVKHYCMSIYVFEDGTKREIVDYFTDASDIRVICNNPSDFINLSIGDIDTKAHIYYISTEFVSNDELNRVVDFKENSSYCDKELIFTEIRGREI